MAGHTKYQIFAAATLYALVSFVLVKPFYFHPIYSVGFFDSKIGARLAEHRPIIRASLHRGHSARRLAVICLVSERG